MSPSGTILALLTGVAGWYYLFYAKAAVGLVELEDQRVNARRIRLRRVGGGIMVLLAVGLYVGFAATDEPVNPRLFVPVWAAVMILLGLLVVLALVDVRLTVRLRKQRRHRGLRGNALDRDGPA